MASASVKVMGIWGMVIFWHLRSNIDVAITVDIARRHAAGLGLASRQVHGGLEEVGLIGRAEELVRLPVGCDQEVKAAVIVDIGKDKLVWVVKFADVDARAHVLHRNVAL